MRPSQQRIKDRAELTELITATCKRRGDSEAHRLACINETLREPEADWPWWREYWRNANPKHRNIEAVKRGDHP